MQIQHGSRLWIIVLTLCIALFLSSLDSTIIATSLVSIAAEFNNYDQSSWVVIAYSVTYSSFLVIFARVSDLTGRKLALLAGLVFFILASLACALARTSDELIIFRALQGIGASGIYSPCMVIASEITPREKAAYLSASLSVVFALASAVGPVLGGAITSHTTWRWCFWLNLPAGAVVMLMAALLIPRDSHSGLAERPRKRIDFTGSVLCLAASVLTLVPLQLGGNQFEWNSIATILLFVFAGLCWLALVIWLVWLDRPGVNHSILPLLPVHIFRNRVVSACLLTLFLTGFNFISTVVYLPQRFQVADDLSSARAGVYMLPLVIVSALAGVVVGFCLSKGNVAASFTFWGNALQLLGLGLLSSLRGTDISSTVNFGYQVIAGFGFGTTMVSAFILARIEVDRKDIAPTVGALTQIRILGGVIGVAVCRVVLFAYVRDNLAGQLPPAAVQSVISSVDNIDDLALAQRGAVRAIYGDGFAAQTRVLMFVACVNLVAALLSFRRHAKPLKEVEAGNETSEELKT